MSIQAPLGTDRLQRAKDVLGITTLEANTPLTNAGAQGVVTAASYTAAKSAVDTATNVVTILGLGTFEATTETVTGASAGNPESADQHDGVFNLVFEVSTGVFKLFRRQVTESVYAATYANAQKQVSSKTLSVNIQGRFYRKTEVTITGVTGADPTTADQHNPPFDLAFLEVDTGNYVLYRVHKLMTIALKSVAIDQSDALQDAIDSGVVELDYNQKYRITRPLVADKNNLVIKGNNATINADNVTGAAITTYSGSGTSVVRNLQFSNFNIVGTADYGLCFLHTTNSSVKNVHLSELVGNTTLTATHGFVFGYGWGNRYERLYSNGAQITDSCFYVTSGVLASIFDLLYTSNFSDYSVKLDAADQSFINAGAWGSGRLYFNMPIVQGANKYGIYHKDYDSVTYDHVYSENCLGILRLDKGNNIVFVNPQLSGVRGGTSTHDIWLGSSATSTSNIHFTKGSFANLPKMLGRINQKTKFDQPQVTGNAEFFPLLRRSSDAVAWSPIEVDETTNEHSVSYRKSVAGYAGQYAKITYSTTPAQILAAATIPVDAVITRY